MNILLHLGIIVFVILFVNGLESANANWQHVPGYKHTEDKSFTFMILDRVFTISWEDNHMYHNLWCMIKHKIKI